MYAHIRDIKNGQGLQLVLMANPEYTKEKGRYLPAFTGEFLIHTMGPQKAFGVEIKSEDAIGQDHNRLTVSWTPQSTCVSSETVPVSMICHSQKGNSGHSSIGSQVEEYMKQKVGPKELIAMVRYADFDGKQYSKKWKIYRKRDAIGFMKVHCDPMPD